MATLEEREEDRWMGLIGAGDEGAFELLVRAWTARVHSFVLKILRDRQQAEEVTQDVFLKVWRQAASFDRSRGRASSWLFSIAHHQAIDRLRANRVRGAVVTAPHEDMAAFVQATPSGVGAWERLRMEQALGRLSAPQREVVYLAYFDGLSREELAQRLGIPVGTAKTRLRDALIKLRGSYQDPSGELKRLDDGPEPSCSGGRP
jgi:RNA polymerase sigma-70 factor, ECF subfamily